MGGLARMNAYAQHSAQMTALHRKKGGTFCPPPPLMALASRIAQTGGRVIRYEGLAAGHMRRRGSSTAPFGKPRRQPIADSFVS
ncbi:MAG TPA: hypothetical protein DCF73_15755, partial [Rhodobiaceae bacterium]|nr:hypothetical protein [Rhodobiaceae bacterium]